jgi:hypothetical protein
MQTRLSSQFLISAEQKESAGARSLTRLLFVCSAFKGEKEKGTKVQVPAIAIHSESVFVQKGGWERDMCIKDERPAG